MTLTQFPLVFWFCAVPAVTLFGLSKGGFGSGIGVIATPLLTLAIPAAHAVGLLLPLLIVSDMFALFHYRKTFDRHVIKIMLPAGCLGVAAGGFFFNYFQESQRVLQMAIGVVALLFVGFQAFKALIIGIMEKRRSADAQGLFFGFVSGFSSTLAHAGGPPALMYLLPLRLEKRLFVGSMVIFFATVNALKLIPYYYLGLLKTGDITTLLILAPLAYAGVRLGIFLNRRFSDHLFTRVIYTLLFLTGVQLVLGRNLLHLLFI